MTPVKVNIKDYGLIQFNLRLLVVDEEITILPTSVVFAESGKEADPDAAYQVVDDFLSKNKFYRSDRYWPDDFVVSSNNSDVVEATLEQYVANNLREAG